jgi:hypothetical protein
MTQEKDTDYSTYHDKLRQIYSDILLKNLKSNEDLSYLMDDDVLFQGLKKWFGTAPPNNNRVKKDLKNLIDKKIKSQTKE